MIALLRLALTALVLWLRLKNASAHYDLQQRIERDIAADELELATARGVRNAEYQLRADRLLDRIARARGIIGALPDVSAAPPAPGARPGDCDPRRDLPAAE